MLPRVAAVVVPVLLGACLSGAPASRDDRRGTGDAAAPVVASIVRVIDGDTFVATVAGAEERVRLIGIDTPERGEPNGPKATAAVRELLAPGGEVYLRYDVERRDRYRRLLAYVWLTRPRSAGDTGAMLNARIVRIGWARTLTIPPNVAYAELFLRLQREARTARRGMWATEPFA